MKKYPPRMRLKGNRLYHVHRQKWQPLGPADDLQAAMRRYNAIEQSLADPNVETMAGLMAAFRGAVEGGRILSRSGKPLSERTRDEYLRQLKPSGRIAKVFGGLRLESIRPVDIGEYLERHPARVAANREKALISRMYRYAIGRGYRGQNPCLGIDNNPEVGRDRYVTDAQYAAAFEQASVSQRMLMALAYLYGARLSALLRIDLSDIDREAGEIPIVDKGATRSRLVLTPEAEEVISWHLDQQAGMKAGQTWRDRPTPLTGRPLIRNTRGRAWTRTNWAKYWRRLMEDCIASGALSNPFTPHDLRAKHATDLEEQNLDAQLALGHYDPSMTKRYIRHPKGRKVYPISGGFSPTRKSREN